MARGSQTSVHEVIALHQRIAARRAKRAQLFTLARIAPARFYLQPKGPAKLDELRPSRPIARAEAARLHPVAERTGLVDKVARRVLRAGRMRLFRLWKIFGKAGDPGAPPPPEVARPLAERLAWLRRSRRL
jgi:hypothetical protein